MQDDDERLRPARVDGRSIQSRVLEQVRDMIISGETLPGAALSEVALADAFGVSRTPVREALKQLQVEGLVEIKPRVGTFVAEPSRRELGELFTLKEVFEGLGARLLAQRGNVAELAALEQNVVASEAAVREGRTAEYAELVHDFHSLIIDGADNQKLSSHYRTLINQLAYHRFVMTSLKSPGRPEKSVAEHRRILEAITAKDAEDAERTMRDHVRNSYRELAAELARQSILEEKSA